MPQSQILLVHITCPADAAPAMAEALVRERLAACVNMLPGVRSVYLWEGRMEQAEETLLVAKTTQDRYPALEAAVRRLHPYELPEIVAVHVARGLPAYLRWVEDSTTA